MADMVGCSSSAVGLTWKVKEKEEPRVAQVCGVSAGEPFTGGGLGKDGEQQKLRALSV